MLSLKDRIALQQKALKIMMSARRVTGGELKGACSPNAEGLDYFRLLIGSSVFYVATGAMYQVLSELDICSYYLLTGRLAGHEKRRWCFREERERSDAKLG